MILLLLAQKEDSERESSFDENDPAQDLFNQFDEVGFEMTPDIEDRENEATENKENNAIIVEDDAGELLDREIQQIR